MTPPPVLGLTGGIGAGKSEALSAFARHGAAVLSSDRVVHDLYELEEVRRAVEERFGPDVIGTDGAVDRARLGGLAFGDPDAVAFLEDLLHPRIRGARERWIDEQRSLDPPPPVLICEVPLLFEAGLEDLFDGVLVITAPEDVRRARVAARGQDFAARAAHQTPEHEKVARADRVFVNDGSLGDIERWAASVIREHARSVAP